MFSHSSRRNYTGCSSDLISRFRSHNFFGKDGTRRYRPWIVVHVEFFSTKADALKREKYYKSGRGLYKKLNIIDDFLARWAHTLPPSKLT
jgi:putative endonuclease